MKGGGRSSSCEEKRRTPIRRPAEKTFWGRRGGGRLHLKEDREGEGLHLLKKEREKTSGRLEG